MACRRIEADEGGSARPIVVLTMNLRSLAMPPASPKTCGSDLAGCLGAFACDEEAKGAGPGEHRLCHVLPGRDRLVAMTNGDLPLLGRLSAVPPREVWSHEARDFTPWLLNNVDVLSELLGMDLALDVAEHPVGGFSLDLMGRDVTTGEVVIVENQLETSDHAHLGQILTYAAGTDPATIVWVAASFRPEHRAAIDWLNTRTDESTRFFGVELGVVRIGQSAPAPSFRLVAQPNDWEKTVRAGTSLNEVTGKQVLYRSFWTRWIDLMAAERPGWSRAKRPPRDSWFSTTTGTSGVHFYTSFTRQGLSSELAFEDPDAEVNTARLRALEANRRELEDHYGQTLAWQDLPGRKSTRIAEYLTGADVLVEGEWDRYLAWLLDRQTRLRAALDHVGGVPRA